jgi:hypothetical protein
MPAATTVRRSIAIQSVQTLLMRLWINDLFGIKSPTPFGARQSRRNQAWCAIRRRAAYESHGEFPSVWKPGSSSPPPLFSTSYVLAFASFAAISYMSLLSAGAAGVRRSRPGPRHPFAIDEQPWCGGPRGAIASQPPALAAARLPSPQPSLRQRTRSIPLCSGLLHPTFPRGPAPHCGTKGRKSTGTIRAGTVSAAPARVKTIS